MSSRTFWNTSRGRFETEARRSLKAADLGPGDDLAALTVLAIAIGIDQRLNSHSLTLDTAADFGDGKLQYHVNRALAELGRAMDRCLITPQSRSHLFDSSRVVDPMAEVSDNVRSLLRG